MMNSEKHRTPSVRKCFRSYKINGTSIIYFNLLVISADFYVLIKINTIQTKPYYTSNTHNRLKHII